MLGTTARTLRLTVATALAAGLVHGTTTHAAGSSSAPLVLSGEAVGDRAGFQISDGDLDGDGVTDLVVGAYKDKRGGEDAGVLYVEYGPITRGFSLKDADLKLHGAAAFDFVGEGPVAAVDVDDDGADDLLIGAPGSFLVEQGTPKIGETYLLYGGKRRKGTFAVPQVADATFTGVHAGEWLGFGTAGVGDLDVDGFEDVVLGAPATAGYTGALYVLYGRAERFRGTVDVTDAADATLLGTTPNGMFGYEAAGGDLDGDGASDLAIAGGPLQAPTPAPLFVVYGGKGRRLSGVTTAVQTADARLVATSSSSLSQPWWLSAGADLTGDGKGDLVASNGQAVVNAQQTSRTYVVPGGARLPAVGVIDALATTTILGTGYSHAVGDVTGDRRPDLVTGNRITSTVSTFRGPLPTGTLAPSAALRTFTAGPTERAGQALALADVTGDGRLDTLVGADDNALGTGRVYVLRGR